MPHPLWATSVLIFPIFATLIWSLAMYWRRKWPSFAIVTAAVIFLLVLIRLLNSADGSVQKNWRLFLELMWPYLGLTGGVGYYICCLPRRPAGPLHCRKCGYHLVGLPLSGLNCPECGTQWRGQGSGLEEKPVELIPIPTRPIPRRKDIPQKNSAA